MKRNHTSKEDPFPVPVPSTLTLEDGRLERRTSTITSAGHGLFVSANTHFAVGQLITTYDGKTISWKQAQALRTAKKDQYVRKLVWGFSAVDARDKVANLIEDERGVGGLINCAPTKQKANCKFKRKEAPPDRLGIIVQVVATRTIGPGEELFIKYGDSTLKEWER